MSSVYRIGRPLAMIVDGDGIRGGVHAYAQDSGRARALQSLSKAMVGERF